MVHVEKSFFGTTKDGKKVDKYTLINEKGVEVEVISFGAVTVAIKCPDKDGKIDDILLGYDTLEGYLSNAPYFGATVGRVANRIANAKFTLDGKEYHLADNDPPNSLHGGWIGFNKVLWEGIMGSDHVTFKYTSADGEEGYPGELKVSVTYTLTEENELKISYRATTSKPTPVNLTNHSYFNLGGQTTKDVLDYMLWIDAESYLPTNEVQIPTGEIRPVSGAPDGALDFRTPKPIGRDINKLTPPGYDFTLCVSNGEGCKARAIHPTNGRVLEVYTDQPGVQLYTGNGLDGNIGKGGLHYKKYSAVCLEMQNYPNAINQPNFPNCVLRPGEEYKQESAYKFLVNS
ncbi:aldose 1-epimerase-like [Actinia tenebrosa]|uniref:Aldose 1-epimerase n=1 Tax=Actinia tenebrosa TaxID=6105 RepID=A0A6P8I8F7_ACTTE|nr:aldose 1-epimerase-like [Actinia tenebrosa]